jgi:CubicO group peptidase (beta-lactamase class C family)
MKQLVIILCLCLAAICCKAQSMYFPPVSGNTWDTISPARLGWCQSNIDSLYSYLAQTNTDAFIILKDGKIVLEKYFGSFTADSIHYWASAGKSLTATLIGIAQDNALVDITQPVSAYLGNGWSAAPTVKEGAIQLRHLLSMTSGLDDTPALPCDNESPETACLRYQADTGTRWAYHTGAYIQLQSVLTAVTGQGPTAYTNSMLGNKIGMQGFWFDGVYYSKARSMARFGLLSLNKGVWAADSILKSTEYFNSMITTSQPYNNSYGYLWWLNGKSSYMSPGLQFTFNGSLIPNAPADMYAALGKNDQKIYVVPSQAMVVIRTGESAYGTALAFSPFDDRLWGKIDSLGIACKYNFTGNGNWSSSANWQNQELPPPVLGKQANIYINPVPGGNCILNQQQTISSGSNLVIPTGTQLIIQGNLTIKNQ